VQLCFLNLDSLHADCVYIRAEDFFSLEKTKKNHQDWLHKDTLYLEMFSQDHNILLNKGVKPPKRLDVSTGQ
jgi:hypothetical protein